MSDQSLSSANHSDSHKCQPGAKRHSTQSRGRKLPLVRGSLLDLILHPQGYTGTENALTVEVCIDPASLVPSGSVLTDMEQSVQNNIAAWNQLQPLLGNSILSTANNTASGALDFESVALHELGHCIGLAHVNAASESGLSGSDANYTKATEGNNGDMAWILPCIRLQTRPVDGLVHTHDLDLRYAR